MVLMRNSRFSGAAQKRENNLISIKKATEASELEKTFF